MSDPEETTREYSNGELTVVWKAGKCVHSGICAAGLRAVFDPKRRPWIDVSTASSEAIAAQVAQCPSGALSLKGAAAPAPSRSGTLVEVTANGPLLVHGEVTMKLPDGTSTTHQKVTALCRCGASGKKPFCDGSHKKVGFSG